MSKDIKNNTTLFTVEETAKLMKLSSQTIRKMIKNNEITHIKIGRNIRITEKEINRILNTVQE